MLVTPKSPPFRRGSRVANQRIALLYNSGGIGDYIQWTTAIKYVIKTYDYISGYVVAPSYFGELAHLWLDWFDPRFEVRVEDVDNYSKVPYLKDIPIVAPDKTQMANATGFHLFHLGFIYYNQKNEVPEGWFSLPEIRGDEADVSRFSLPKDYVVLTPNATVPSRRLTARVVNETTKWLKDQGLTPVFLGKKDVTTDHKGISDEGISTEGILDLRNQTTLTEAAVIMAKAKLTFGLDNGLLHLASCSKAPVAWLFTTIDPKLRLPPRPEGAVTTILTPEGLDCRFCNSNIRYVINHEFKECIYGDYVCTKNMPPKEIIFFLKQTLEKINAI